MPLFRTAMLLLLLLVGGGAPLRAQAAVPAPAQGTVAAQGGLPLRGEPPRTLRAQAHVYIAFAIAWVLLFGYALWLGRRFARLEREIGRLEGGPPPA